LIDGDAVTAFFIPGLSDDPRLLEDAYGEMRRQIELDLGHQPSARRILSLWTRQGRVDCITEVGRADPLRGGTVMAIFDMGPRQPFVVWRQPADGMRDGIREVLGCNAYAVSEFDR
jgi:hypothetical protein